MSTPGGNAVSVAEGTFALMLAMARQVSRLDKSMHEGKWEKKIAAGTEVRGKTLGLIGLGRIGGEVAVRAEAFDMRVIGWDRVHQRSGDGNCRSSLCRWRGCWRRATSFRCTQQWPRRRRE